MSSLEADLARWREHLNRFAALLGNPPDRSARPAPEAAPGHCLVFAPHPDDECIVGALPLRLQQEAGWRISNVAVTLGSNPERRESRWAELVDACGVLGFDCIRVGADGLSDVRADTAEREPELWAAHVGAIAALLTQHRPALVLAPHALDDNPSHRGVYRLVAEAIATARLDTVLAHTEFWSTQAEPNALVQTNIADTARLIAALERHAGEIERNPYHLRLPAFLADAVRRGGELVLGAGEEAPDFAFATLYRLVAYRDGQPAGDLPRHVYPADQALSSALLKS
ncbi:LmbE family N-acetylglucosaminyl deacetylase [Pelomonas saccharophila]|uniref:LmbE family N-acetylglucosaminyl deacetylase n=1 Tax=Roseateles saccharophilus TaxID=304 RepID=A0ABU1YTA8_ROSSA|nr:PIG-L family deacetylase [Roseateles saccharophilus]MDR7272095.1 LmbE family N-acetylglucosaminyl deacetylase [Roseateles saccharophilus]